MFRSGQKNTAEGGGENGNTITSYSRPRRHKQSSAPSVPYVNDAELSPAVGAPGTRAPPRALRSFIHSTPH